VSSLFPKNTWDSFVSRGAFIFVEAYMKNMVLKKITIIAENLNTYEST
jgi:hypothetical protein